MHKNAVFTASFLVIQKHYVYLQTERTSTDKIIMVTDDITTMKYNVIQDFVNLNDVDIIKKIVLYMRSIMPADKHDNNIQTLRSLCGSISEEDADKMQNAIRFMR